MTASEVKYQIMFLTRMIVVSCIYEVCGPSDSKDPHVWFTALLLVLAAASWTFGDIWLRDAHQPPAPFLQDETKRDSLAQPSAPVEVDVVDGMLYAFYPDQDNTNSNHSLSQRERMTAALAIAERHLRPKIEKECDEKSIKRMVDRFLRWKLPENFNPDGGIIFKKMRNENTPYPAKNEPVGTNLLDADQAEEMVRFMLANDEGTPDPRVEALRGLRFHDTVCIRTVKVGDDRLDIALTDAVIEKIIAAIEEVKK